MGLQSTPGYIGQTGFQTPVELDRNFVEALAGGRSGAFRYGDFTLTPSASNMSMTIGAGSGVVVGAESATQGGYFFWSDATDTVTFPAASGSPRIDTLLVRILDPQYGTISGLPRIEWKIFSGTPSGSPVALADSSFNVGGANYQPGAWMRMAEVLIPNGVTNLQAGGVVVTQKFNYARVGRDTVVLSTATLPSDAKYGDTATNVSDGSIWTYFTSWMLTGGRKPFVQLYLPANWSIADNTNVAVPWGTGSETGGFDNFGFHSEVTNNTRITPNIQGRYNVRFMPVFTNNVTGDRRSWIAKNGVLQTPHSRVGFNANSLNYSPSLPVSKTVYCNGTSDYIEAMVYQNSGAALNLSGNSDLTQNSVSAIEVEYMGPYTS